MMYRFTDNANHILNEYLINKTTCKLIDGEARTRTYHYLKQKARLEDLLEENGELNLTNEWVYKLIEDYITQHEGAWGDNTHQNQLNVYIALKRLDDIHLLFEGHYNFDDDFLL